MSCDSKENDSVKRGHDPLFWGIVASILSIAWLVGSGGMELVPAIIAGCVLVVMVIAAIVKSFSFHRALKKRLAALEDILQVEKGGVLLIDSEGQELFRSPNAPLFGQPHDVLAPLKQRGMENPLLVEECVFLSVAAATGLVHRTEIALVAPGGQHEWYEFSIRPLKEGTLWRYEDVTSRRAIEETLSSEYERLSDLVDFLPAGFCACDSDGLILFINHRLAEWLGSTPRQLIGKSIFGFFSSLPMPEEERAEARLLGPHGESTPVIIYPNLFDEGDHSYICSLVIKQPSSKDTEIGGPPELLAEAAWFDDIPVGIVQLDLNQDIVRANATFSRMLGLEAQQITDRPLRNYIVEEDRAIAFGQIARVLMGETCRIRMDIRLLGQKEQPALVHVSALKEEENLVGLMVYAIDATERRNLEQQFAQSQKIQAMGQLAGGVAHDFNNLLTAMIGFCDLLLQRHGAGDPSFSDIMQVKQNANRAASLVRQLLAFSRRQTLQPRLLNVTDALVELSALLRRLLGEHIELVMSHERDMGLIRVDPGQFDQVIINLAVNARDAMPGGGTLTIRSRMAVVEQPVSHGSETMPRGRYVLIEVSDTGTGISKENLERIFEPFFSTKELGEGTGLGLSTVYGIVRQTEGFVFVDSVPGRGATFSIYLPSFEAEKESERSPSPREKEALNERAASGRVNELAGSGTILLVEDEEPVRMFGARALRNKGYKVIEVASGEQAVEVLRDNSDIDVLISDVMMPGMDGITLMRLVRIEYPDIRVILISGYSENMASTPEMLEGGVRFLSKPFSLRQLAEEVRKAMAEEN